MKIVAIGKSQYSSNNSNWTNGNSIPGLVDLSPNNIWTSWGASQRDLFFLDSDGVYETHFDITSWNYNAVYDQITDLIQTMNIPFHAEYSALLNSYPNPFNPSTNIIISISQGSNSLISIYDISGRYLETLSKSYFLPGSYTLTWNASDYPSGIYFIRLELDSYLISQKLVLAK